MAAIQTKKPTNPGKGEPIGHRGSGPQQAQKGERADDEPGQPIHLGSRVTPATGATIIAGLASRRAS